MKVLKAWQIATFVIFGMLCVVTVAGVIYGVTSHTEPGFMSTTPEWEPGDFPLDLCVHSYGLDYLETDGNPVHAADYTRAERVVSIINTRLGFEAYRMSGGDACEVMLTVGVPVEAGWQDPGGSAEILHKTCDAVTANVTGEVAALVMQHELGHCLGLDHDDSESSIMRRVQRETPTGELSPWITDFDRELIRRTYLP